MMDGENAIFNFVSFSVEVFVTCLVLKQYRSSVKCLKSLKEAQHLELDSNLKKTVEDNDGVLKYVAISGKVQALTAPLRSQFVPHLSGVIREKITVERKIQWNPFLGIWGSSNNVLLESINNIPFALCGKSLNVFKKKISVEIVEPLAACELVIPTVYDEFQCYHDNIGTTVFDIFRGEKTLGIQEIEKLLCEDEVLLAVGKLVVENNKLKIKPPDDGLNYFLTTLSMETLINKLQFSTKVLKFWSVVLSTICIATFIYLSSLSFSEIKRRINRRLARKKWEKERKMRRMADKSRSAVDEEAPKCIICLENPIEVILLECGHLCLCYNCSDHIKKFCPICRHPITRTVSAFWA